MTICSQYLVTNFPVFPQMFPPPFLTILHFTDSHVTFLKPLFSLHTGLIYVIDSNDRDRFSLAYDELDGILSDDAMRGVPVVVLANKQDLPNAASTSDITDALKLHKLRDRWAGHCVIYVTSRRCIIIGSMLCKLCGASTSGLLRTLSTVSSARLLRCGIIFHLLYLHMWKLTVHQSFLVFTFSSSHPSW